ncbi:MAG: hypothetical protein AABW59_04520 [archaeon]
MPTQDWQEIEMNHKLLAAFAAMILVISFFGIAFAENGDSTTSKAPQADALKEKYQERIDNAKEAFIKAQEKFDKVKEDFNIAKDKWIQAKKVWDSNKSDTNKFFTHAKNYLLKSTEKMQNHLELSKTRVLSMKNISEADLNDLIEKYDLTIAELDAIIVKINAATDKNDLAAIAEEIKNVWMNAKNLAKRNAGLIVSANVAKLIDNTSNVIAKIEAKAIEFDNNGLDMTATFEKIAQAKAYIVSAQDQLDIAINNFQNVNGLETDANFMSEGKAAIREAHSNLKKAHESAKLAIQEMVKAKKAAGISDAPEDSNARTDENNGVNA